MDLVYWHVRKYLPWQIYREPVRPPLLASLLALWAASPDVFAAEQANAALFGKERLDVADLDSGKVFRGALWFPELRQGLRRQIGATVLGRMTQGVAKPGQSAPWILADATAEAADLAKAKAFKAANPDFWK